MPGRAVGPRPRATGPAAGLLRWGMRSRGSGRSHTFRRRAAREALAGLAGQRGITLCRGDRAATTGAAPRRTTGLPTRAAVGPAPPRASDSEPRAGSTPEVDQEPLWP